MCFGLGIERAEDKIIVVFLDKNDITSHFVSAPPDSIYVSSVSK